MIKPLLIIAFIALFSLTVRSQSDFRSRFRSDISLGYASPLMAIDGTSNIKKGVSLSAHTHYYLSDEFSIGLRTEVAYFSYSATSADGSAYDDSQTLQNNSFCFTAEYYFSNNYLRPFIGAGAGFFQRSTLPFTLTDATIDLIPDKTQSGGFAEAGIEVENIRFCTDYNYTPNKTGYFGVKIGYAFGRHKYNSSGAGSGKSRRRSTWEGTP